jgi:excisionase family DNA binding protein
MPFQIRDITLYSVPEISQVLNVTTTTTRNYLKKGILRGQKIHGKWVISYEDLMAYIKGF